MTGCNCPIHLSIANGQAGQSVKSRPGQEDFGWQDYLAYSKICTHAGCPASLYEQQTSRLLCPCHQSQFDVLQDAKPVFGPATRPLPKLPLEVDVGDGRQYFVAAATSSSPSALLSGSAHDTTRNDGSPRAPRAGHPPGKVADWVDDRLHLAGPMRKQLNKVFPDHWSFMLGEIALYSFIILLLTGTFLTFFFDASMAEVVYHGRVRAAARASTMSRAYESTLNICFDVRGGLMIRQIHHWAALLFMAAMVVHMLPDVLHRRVPQAARAQLDHRRARCSCSASSRASPATRCPTTCCPAPGLRDRRRDHAVDPGGRHLGCRSCCSAASFPGT